MPRFKVPIEAAEPGKTEAALINADIERVGPSTAGYPGNPESWKKFPHVTAIVEAETPEAAAAKVREVVGPDDEIGEVQPYGGSG